MATGQPAFGGVPAAFGRALSPAVALKSATSARGSQLETAIRAHSAGVKAECVLQRVRAVGRSREGRVEHTGAFLARVGNVVGRVGVGRGLGGVGRGGAGCGVLVGLATSAMAREGRAALTCDMGWRKRYCVLPLTRPSPANSSQAAPQTPISVTTSGRLVCSSRRTSAFWANAIAEFEGNGRVNVKWR